MKAKLSDLDIQRALATLPGWMRKGESLAKTFQRPDFVDAMKVVNQVAEAAERRNHHPDIDIRYNKLTFTLSSHDAGGITQRDLDLGGEIEKIAGG
jgi:4a-hydroxytetrahydrobiopterin dehydratase